MNYKEFVERLENNLYFGNRYMGNTVFTCFSELSTSKNETIKTFAENTLEEVKKLREPFHYSTGQLVDNYSLDQLTKISHKIMNLLEEHY